MAQYVIGVDGGGTKTLGAIATLDGNVLAQHEVGSTNHHSNPIEVVRANLSSLCANLLQAAGAQSTEVIGICLGMAGVDRPEDRPLIQGLVKEFLPVAQCTPVNDGVIALMGGALKPFGIIVISGTGSIAFGLNKAGERARANGWGNILGDEGSGYSIALRGLRAVMRSCDGRTGPTKLRDIVFGHFGFDRHEQILTWIKEIQGAKADIAALSRLVHEAGEAGDETAMTILREEADELAVAATSVAAKLFPDGEKGYEVVVAGGNLRKSKSFYALFEEAVGRRLPGIAVTHPRKEPVEGAVLQALEYLKANQSA